MDVFKLEFLLEYKFVLYNKEEKCVEVWENNFNCYLVVFEIKVNEMLVIVDWYVYFNIFFWKGVGVVVFVFLLKLEKSFGVGDFGDLKRMVDWVVSIN